MPARWLAASLVVASLAFSIAPSRPHEASAREPSRPNILIVVTDDQRATGTLGVMPATRRWFGVHGTRFHQAFATTPLCCPSRATILTGRYAHNHGVQQNDPGPGDGSALDHSTTIQRYLDDAGYRTGIVGKLVNHWDLGERPPFFDAWAIFEGGYEDEVFDVDGRLRRIPGYSTNVLSRLSTRFVRDAERRDGQPWFLYVAPFAPHAPATPASRYRGARVPGSRGSTVRERDRTDKPAYLRGRAADPAEARALRRRQLRTLHSVDDLVARLARTLRALGETRDTLAVFLSDNGFAWGDRGWVGKSVPYTESIRIPFLVRWPAGTVGVRRESRRITATVDVAPTVLDAAGVAGTFEEPLDGRSLLRPWRRPWILTEFWRSSVDVVDPWASIRSRTFHYIEHYDAIALVPTFREYYDLRSDPDERRNLLARGASGGPSAARLAALSAQLAVARRCTGRGALTGCP